MAHEQITPKSPCSVLRHLPGTGCARLRRLPDRDIHACGYGDCRIEISTPAGTPSMRGKVSTLARLRIEESDRGGLKQRKFEPFPGAGAAKERDLKAA